jgi:site-specific recombinase XerD
VIGKFERELARLVEFCEGKRKFYLPEVTLPDLTEFRATWESEYPSSITRQRVQGRLKGFFRYATRARFIQYNPASDLTPIKEKKVPTLPLTRDQYQKLLDTIPEEFPDTTKAAKVRALVQCMRYTGLAIRDAVCLERSQVHFDKKRGVTLVVTNRTKTGVDVLVPIPADVSQELEAAAKVNGSQLYFFWQTGNGKPESAVTNWQHDLRALFHSTGMSEGHPHQLRDTAAVEWMLAGIPLEEVSKLLGHTSVKTTEKSYAPWVKARQDRLVSLVMNTWKPEQKPQATCPTCGKPYTPKKDV